MTEEHQGNDFAAQASSFPAKRGRGRPRKDENSSCLFGSDGMKKNQRQRIDSTSHAESAFIGQIISGVLDGSFEAGYLLTAKVGNTDTILRGLVFEPRLAVPISVENDIAPHVKMFRRSEVTLPIAAHPLNQVPLVVPQQEVMNESVAKPLQTNIVIHQSEGLLNESNCVLPQAALEASSEAEVKTKSETPLKTRFDGVDQAVLISPQGSVSQIEKGKSIGILPKDEISLPPNISVPVAASASRLELLNQEKAEISAAQALPLECEVKNPSPTMQENGTSIQTEGPSNVAAAALSNSNIEAKTEQAVQIRQGNETDNEMPNAADLAPHFREVQNETCLGPEVSDLSIPAIAKEDTLDMQSLGKQVISTVDASTAGLKNGGD